MCVQRHAAFHDVQLFECLPIKRMEHKAGFAFSHTAEYTFIESALKARWAPFSALADELKSFVPKTIDDFADRRASELARLKRLNPASAEAELLDIVDDQIRANAKPEVQMYLRFADRVMAEYVTVAFLSHALAEAAINAILAVGLATSGAPEVFSLLERTDIKEKWLVGPKAFHPAYTFHKGGALFQTLQHLTRQRNAFVHYKIELEMGGEKKLEGSKTDRASWATHVEWIKRFFSLPYDLAWHARVQIPRLPTILLYDSSPIAPYAPHAPA